MSKDEEEEKDNKLKIDITEQPQNGNDNEALKVSSQQRNTPVDQNNQNKFLTMKEMQARRAKEANYIKIGNVSKNKAFDAHEFMQNRAQEMQYLATLNKTLEELKKELEIDSIEDLENNEEACKALDAEINNNKWFWKKYTPYVILEKKPFSNANLRKTLVNNALLYKDVSIKNTSPNTYKYLDKNKEEIMSWTINKSTNRKNKTTTTEIVMSCDPSKEGALSMMVREAKNAARITGNRIYNIEVNADNAKEVLQLYALAMRAGLRPTIEKGEMENALQGDDSLLKKYEKLRQCRDKIYQENGKPKLFFTQKLKLVDKFIFPHKKPEFKHKV